MKIYGIEAYHDSAWHEDRILFYINRPKSSDIRHSFGCRNSGKFTPPLIMSTGGRSSARILLFA